MKEFTANAVELAAKNGPAWDRWLARVREWSLTGG